MEVSRYVKQLREALAQVYKIIVPKESNRHNDYSLDQEDGMLLHGGYGSPSLDPGASASANAIKAFRKRATFALMRAQANYNKYLAPTVLRISSLCLYFLSACIVLAQLTIYEGKRFSSLSNSPFVSAFRKIGWLTDLLLIWLRACANVVLV